MDVTVSADVPVCVVTCCTFVWGKVNKRDWSVTLESTFVEMFVFIFADDTLVNEVLTKTHTTELVFSPFTIVSLFVYVSDTSIDCVDKKDVFVNVAFNEENSVFVAVVVVLIPEFVWIEGTCNVPLLKKVAEVFVIFVPFTSKLFAVRVLTLTLRSWDASLFMNDVEIEDVASMADSIEDVFICNVCIWLLLMILSVVSLFPRRLLNSLNSV